MHFIRTLLIFIGLVLLQTKLVGQLPDFSLLNTAASSSTTRLPVGSYDINWSVSYTSNPSPTDAYVCGNCIPTFWTSSPWINANWITYNFGNGCDHSPQGTVDFYFSRSVDLPDFYECDRNIENDFCLNVDFLVDNDVWIITVNGVNNYSSPVTTDPNYYQGFVTPRTAALCQGWQAGSNEITFQVKSAIPKAGFLARFYYTPPPVIYDRVTLTEQICRGGSIYDYTQPGIYIDTLVDANGCYTIRTLNLSFFADAPTIQNISICTGQQYEGYSATGTYVDMFTSIDGCDSVRTLNLVVVNILNTLERVTICDGGQYLGYSRSGTYVDNFTSAGGCDSVRTLILNVFPSFSITQSETICSGKSKYGYSKTGVYIDTLSSVNSCDSIRILNLNISSPISRTERLTLCDGQQIYGYSSTGIYRDTLVSDVGCDSVRVLNLTVVSTKVANEIFTICAGQQFYGYKQTGVFQDTLQSIEGCDSIRILTLNVTPVIIKNETRKICLGQQLYGYTTSGTYRDTLVTNRGCDSIRVLSLSVESEIRENISLSLCSEDFPYDRFSSPGIYSDTLASFFGCDSIIVFNIGRLELTNTTKDTSACNNLSLKIVSLDASNVIWSNGVVGKSNLITQNGMYTAVYKDKNGCEANQTFNVKISDEQAYIPNIFSPNDDGSNDYFKPVISSQALTNYEFIIYDRWGSLVYKDNTNNTLGWDGTHTNAKALPGVYAYYLRAIKAGCPDIVKKGSVTLIR